ncbi:MAG: hypothetical protein D6770_10530 [Anaerolineae bacterium]|nr:MAG: hypothetical protein D6770_10530 [Anaerolineae bacterium]
MADKGREDQTRQGPLCSGFGDGLPRPVGRELCKATGQEVQLREEVELLPYAHSQPVFRLLRVAGDSLSPEYRDGDFVLLVTLPFFLRRLQEGDVIVFRHAGYGTLIKRVLRVDPEQGIYVTGSGPGSLDSRRLGPIRRRAVVGKVIVHIPASRPKGRV